MVERGRNPLGDVATMKSNMGVFDWFMYGLPCENGDTAVKARPSTASIGGLLLERQWQSHRAVTWDEHGIGLGCAQRSLPRVRGPGPAGRDRTSAQGGARKVEPSCEALDSLGLPAAPAPP